ncbi:hypothetical protein GCM10022221_22660 [Actinocorallia aurea]
MRASTGIELLGTVITHCPGDLPVALAAWEGRMRPFIAARQSLAVKERLILTPDDRREILVRRGMMS